MEAGMSDERAADRSDREAILALLAAPAHVDDGGFGDRVMGALPPRRRSRAVFVLVPLATTVACAVTVVTDGAAVGRAVLTAMAPAVDGATAITPVAVAAMVCALAAAVAALREA
jgi:hypothetical protein